MIDEPTDMDDGAVPADATWLTLPDAAQAAGVSVSALRKWYTTGDIPSKMGPGPTGERRFVPLEAVLERSRRSAPTSVPPGPSASAGPVASVPEGYALVPKAAAERDIYRERLDDARRAQREAEAERDRLAGEIAELRSGPPAVAPVPETASVAAPTPAAEAAPADVPEVAEPAATATEVDEPVVAPPSGTERTPRSMFVEPEASSLEAPDGAFGARHPNGEAAKYTESFLAGGPMRILDAAEPERLTAEGRRFRGFLRWTRPLRWITYPLDRIHRAAGPTVFPVIVLSLLVAAAIVWFAAEPGAARAGITIGLGVVGLLGAINVVIAILFDRYLGDAIRSTIVRRTMGSVR